MVVRPKIWESTGGRGGIPPWFAQLPKNWDAPEYGSGLI